MSEDLGLARLLISHGTDEQPRVIRCDICGHATVTNQDAATRGEDPDVEAVGVCRPCALTVPPSLLKAAFDYPFDYVLGLRSGHVLRFDGCRFHGQWVNVTLDGNFEDWAMPGGVRAPLLGTPYKFDRGVDVRLDEIVWCADAPQGS
jgi:hypothetical protein